MVESLDDLDIGVSDRAPKRLEELGGDERRGLRAAQEQHPAQIVE
jgi:hypothetical protein